MTPWQVCRVYPRVYLEVPFAQILIVEVDVVEHLLLSCL